MMSRSHPILRRPSRVGAVLLTALLAAPVAADEEIEIITSSSSASSSDGTTTIIEQRNRFVGETALSRLLEERLKALPPNATFHKRIQMQRADGSGEHTHTFVIEYANGELTVLLNGAPVSPEQLRQSPHGVFVQIDASEELPLLLSKSASFFGGDGPGVLEADVDIRVEPRTMIGLHNSVPDDALVAQLELEPGTTTLIDGVYRGLPAWNGGLRAFDVIVAIDGRRPADPDVMRRTLLGKEPGDAVAFDVIRRGQPLAVTVQLAPYDGAALNDAAVVGRIPHEKPSTVLVGPEGNVFVNPHGEGLDLPFGRAFDFETLRKQLHSSHEWAGSEMRGLLHEHLLELLTLPAPAPRPILSDDAVAPNLEAHIRRLEARIRRLETLLDAQAEIRTSSEATDK